MFKLVCNEDSEYGSQLEQKVWKSDITSQHIDIMSHLLI